MTIAAKPQRIALVHATHVAMQPIERAFKNLWPEVMRTNLLEDGLTPDMEAAGHMTEELQERIQRLADYAIYSGATGILFTCSAFCDEIQRVAQRRDLPIMAPNDAMFEAALEAGKRIGMIGTFPPAIEPMTQEFQALVRSRGLIVKLESICVPEALFAARKGDTALHDKLVIAAAPRLADCDAVMLAQFSTSTALAGVQAALGIPVFSAPEAAVLKMRHLLEPN